MLEESLTLELGTSGLSFPDALFCSYCKSGPRTYILNGAVI